MSSPTPGDPSTLSPAGSEADRLAGLWWLVLALGVAVAVFVLVLVVVAMLRRPAEAPDPAGPDGRGRAREDGRDHRFIVGGGLLLPVVVLAVAAVATVTTTQALRRPQRGELPVEVTGAQWFWRVRYPGLDVTTANEVRLPVGRPVDLILRSDDVIHSFWVPRLAGKVDMIPGQTNHLRVTPTEVGEFRGECAEFCGLQHAHMAFVVRVLPRAEFDRWVARRRRGPEEPRAGTPAARGREVFASSSCAGCHTVTGVSDGTRGPDLTDVGGRATLGAGTLPNDRDHLIDWIRDPGTSKPGALMPPSVITAEEIADVAAYLESLR